MPAARVIKAVDVFEYCDLNSATGLPRMPPDQFRLDGFEESFHRCIVITITLATHGYFEAMLAQDFLVVMRTILGGFKRSSQRHGYISFQILFQGLGWCHPVKAFSWSHVEHYCNRFYIVCAMGAEVCSLWKILPKQAIGVLVRSALPRTSRITEVDI